MEKHLILVAGATGNLGDRIVKALLDLDAVLRIVVRKNTEPQKISEYRKAGILVHVVENWDITELTAACKGVSCVVSALAGLEEVIIDAQKALLDAAVKSGVKRFIPSDFSLDFTKFTHGENRNLDLRRKFHQYLDKTGIASTTIFNGAFADLITNEMPLILFKQKLVLYWGNADHRMAFTTMDNTAEYTAHVAMDQKTPRYLRIAGDQISPREIKKVVSEVTGKKFRLFSPGGQGLLGLFIKIAKTVAPGKQELYPAWQGMQYMHNMIDERSDIIKSDNNRYPGIKWTSIKKVLEIHEQNKNTL